MARAWVLLLKSGPEFNDGTFHAIFRNETQACLGVHENAAEDAHTEGKDCAQESRGVSLPSKDRVILHIIAPPG